MDVLSSRTARVRWRRFLEQLSTLALSILLGLIVWLIAINQENPLVQEPFGERIPVTVRGLPETLLPLQDLSSQTVSVVVQAPRSSWDTLDVDDFSAYVNLAGLGEGVHEVDVNVEVLLDPRVRIVSIQPAQLRIQLDPVREKLVPVRVEIMDSTAFGYDWQPPIYEPISVTVRGPATQVEQVTSARAEVFLRNAKSQVERQQPVTPQNGQGQAVARVEVTPAVVRVVVPVEQWPGRKEVAVRVTLDGQPSAGYRLSSVRVNPSTVVLLGSTDVLAQVPGFVGTEPISLTGATSELQRRVQLVVPENVTVLEGNTVDVTAMITPIEGGTTVRQEPVIQGLGTGLQANVAIETVDVILSGPLPLLESLGPDDIFVILDLTGRLPGNHIIVPRVVVPTGIRAEGVLPESVEVVITPQPVVSPEETPTIDEAAEITATVSATWTLPATGTPVAPSPIGSPVATNTPPATRSTPTPTSTSTPTAEVDAGDRNSTE